MAADASRTENWTRWGPYLSERQWGTVREDYSPDGSCWDYFPHDHARSRAYRWGEDGLLGFTDRECRLCFALALWNGKDHILKERLYGLTGPQGNHGEDVKECYYYLDATPTSSYLKALYKYPQRAYPYDLIQAENAKRTRADPEYELLDTHVFDEDRYFDVFVEYAKAATDDILIRITVANRGPEAARLHVLPTLWFRNTWAQGRLNSEYPPKPRLQLDGPGTALAEHATLGQFRFAAEGNPRLLFTDNETNTIRLFGAANGPVHAKDAFHRAIVDGDETVVKNRVEGTKLAALYVLDIPPGEERIVQCRLAEVHVMPGNPFGETFAAGIRQRQAEADEFYDQRAPTGASEEEKRVIRQGYAGLLWSKQFYNYVVQEWLDGDPSQPPPPPQRRGGRNADWRHLHARDILSMPDKWEYPWFAAWDLAFHAVALGRVDLEFAKRQLILLLREWYMHSNGQIPAYEFAFSDVNPPVHAWACWRLYKATGGRREPGQPRDTVFLKRVFHKLLINFTWWVNRKDEGGKHLFSGGFLGLDNIGVFDRSQPLPTGGHLEQADGTAWMAFYCATMLSMALELAREDRSYEDVASKFFEHFISISDAMNTLGGSGLWDETDGFYYDQIYADGKSQPMRIRSMVGVIPLFACEVLDDTLIQSLPGFGSRLQWFLENRPQLSNEIMHVESRSSADHGRRLLALPSRERLIQVLRYVLDENEFLSPYGVRSLSRAHGERPFVFKTGEESHTVAYEPGESASTMFGGNSNWRGPVWFPLNYLLIEALERYHYFYGDALRVECPVGSGKFLTLDEVAREIERRLTTIFLPGPDGSRPVHGGEPRYAKDPHWRDLVLFYEYFHGDTGRGLGASHQTGWTALAARGVENMIRERSDARRRYTPVSPAEPVPAAAPTP
ncbi:MAG TPA: hypothetical protein VNW46_06445 [Gemmatimonadaceae bacterium]|jgi:hypothetical protein|nr:hypothetical protein [Gemmatimonadaceae bacterium]